MSITDELREYADTLSERARYGVTISNPLNPHSGAPIGPTKETEELYAIADRIDETLEEGYIELPKDHDGKYIHIRDWMESPEGVVDVVTGIDYDVNLSGRYTVLRGKEWISLPAYFSRHYHEPAVEDVLDEFASAYDRIGGEDEEHQKYLDLIAEYAAKLQLKEQK